MQVVSNELTVKSEIIEKYCADLTEMQASALRDIVEWYFGENSGKLYSLEGSAGSGKTWTMQRVLLAIRELTKEIDGKNIKIAMCAPTHKALSVVRENAEAVNLKCHIATIHSLLHVIPGDFDEHGNQNLKDNLKSGQPHISEFNLIWNDESSMYDQNLYDRSCLSLGKKNSKMIYTGDDNQLPPVSKNDDEKGSDEITLSPVFTDTAIRRFKLTEVLRYDGEIAQYATSVKNDIDTLFLRNPSHGGNITVLNEDEWLKLFIEMLKDDPLNVRAIAWTNNKVSEMARKAQEHIFGDTEEYHVGEVLSARELVTANVKRHDSAGREVLREETVLYSCQECVIENLSVVVRHVPELGFECELFQIELVSERDDFIIYTPTRKALDKIIKPYLKQMKDKIIAFPNSSAKGGMWKQYYDILNRLCLSKKGNGILYRLQFAGTMTVNQAQGSGYKHVFFHNSNARGCQKAAWRNRLFYTAVTRAKQHLYIIDKKSNFQRDTESFVQPKFEGIWM